MQNNLRSFYIRYVESSAKSLSGPTPFAFPCYKGETAIRMRNYGPRQIWGGGVAVSHLRWSFCTNQPRRQQPLGRGAHVHHCR